MSNSCTIEGCEKPLKAVQMCAMHYARVKAHGSTDLPMIDRSPRSCSVEFCKATAVSRGMCGPHYHRWRKYGDPAGGHTSRGLSEPQRFWPKVDRRGPDDCWPWTASLNQRGYGIFALSGTGGSIPAHRWAYQAWHGPLAPGETVDHTCHNADPSCPAGVCDHRKCCNPAHLEAVPDLENVARGRSFSAVNARKTHCVNGHELTPENCYERSDRRICKPCARERARLHNLRKSRS